jgi:multidrug transporter EmrE-like cation transporter
MRPAIWAIALSSIFLSSVAQLLMKIGMTTNNTLARSNHNLFVAATSPYVLAGFIAYGIGAILWLRVLSETELSLAYPLVSLAFVAVAVMSWSILGESLSIGRITGMILIVTGVALMGTLAS